MIVIGIAGKARSGKDTAADIMLHKLAVNWNVYKISLSESLKIQAMAIGFTKEQLTDQRLKVLPDERFNCTPREYLQKLGDLNRKLLGESVLCKSLESKYINNYPDVNLIFIVSDIRTELEANWIKSFNNGYVLKLIRSNQDDEFSTHITELGIPDNLVDLCIVNNSTIDDLDDELTKFIKYGIGIV